LTNTGYWDAFVVKYDPDGNVLWTRRGGGPHYDIAYGLALDASNSVLVTGFIQGGGTFEDVTITNYGPNRAFLAKYSSDGTLQWLKATLSSSVTLGNAVDTDDEQSVYMTGTYLGTVDFGGRSLTNATGTNWPSYPYYHYSYVAKYSTEGTLLCVKDAPGSLGNFLYSVAVDGQRNCYVAGSLGGEFVVDGVSVSSQGSADLFLARLNGGKPQIGLARTANGLSLTWSTQFMGFTAEWRSSFDNIGTWTLLTNAVVTSNGSFQVQLSASDVQRCFRLRRTSQ
jgi:hypothetical protein